MKFSWQILSFFVICGLPLDGFSDSFLPPQYSASCPNSGNVVQPGTCQPISPAGLGQLRSAAVSAGETAAQVQLFIETMMALDKPVPVIVSGGKENSALTKTDPMTPSSQTSGTSGSPRLSETRSSQGIPLKPQNVEEAGSTGTTRTAESARPGTGWAGGGELYALNEQRPSEAPLRSPRQGGETSPGGLDTPIHRPEPTSIAAGPAGSTATSSPRSIEESVDPWDYFNRTSIEDSLFAVVHRRYKKKAESWAKNAEKI